MSMIPFPRAHDVPLAHDDFDIDVDLSSVLGLPADRGPLLDSRWYEIAAPRVYRPPLLQGFVETVLDRALSRAQWHAATALRERRTARRAPILSRVRGADVPLLACNISRSGLRCSGLPRKSRMDVELKVPGLAFPVDAQVEVVSLEENNVIPLAGMRFVDIDPVYVEHIEGYVGRRGARLAA